VPALAKFNGVGQGGLFYTGSFHQLGAQALAVSISFTTVFALSFGLFWVIKQTVGLRVSPREEMDGLDISEHGMWGYPESFMPVPGGVYRPAEMPTVNPHEGEYVGVPVPKREGSLA
jgi:Amt family ammonium transporter